MNRFYRIYLGARNTDNHKFTPTDLRTLKKVLNRYFKAWTLVTGTGCWDGAEEQCYIATVSTDPATEQLIAGKRPIESMTYQLRQHFDQEAIIIEEGGETMLFH